MARVVRNRRQNADDRLRRLERIAFATQDKADILAYWREALRVQVDPKPNSNFIGRHMWSLDPTRPYSPLPEIEYDGSSYVYYNTSLPGGWIRVSTLRAGIQFILDSQGVENPLPSVTIKVTKRAYPKKDGRWRGDIKIYAKLDKRSVGKLHLNLGNITVLTRYGDQPAATILWIEVDGDLRRQGVATALYAKAAEVACQYGYVLASDVQLREGSRGFWQKQVKHGNAVLVKEPFGDKVRLRYVLDCPPMVNPP